MTKTTRLVNYPCREVNVNSLASSLPIVSAFRADGSKVFCSYYTEAKNKTRAAKVAKRQLEKLLVESDN